MRFSPPAIAFALVLTMVSSVGIGRSVTDSVSPRSQTLVTAGMAAMAAGQIDRAADLYESALAVDPGNRIAFIRLAEVARARGLDGKAIGYYNIALTMDDKDVAAIAGLGEAYAAKGAIERAKASLARVRLICTAQCADGDRLALAIDKAAMVPVRSAAAVQPEPVLTLENP